METFCSSYVDADYNGNQMLPIHSISTSERVAFVEWINSHLANDTDLNLNSNPIDPNNPDSFYSRFQDGILLCKLINNSVPGTIDERTINKTKLDVFRKLENLELALNSAESIGCHVINIRPDDIYKCIPHLILGLVWQIIRKGLLAKVQLQYVPELILLLNEDEKKEDLLHLDPESILVRWVNYHLSKSGKDALLIKNFSSDIKDCKAYTVLLSSIAPKDSGVRSIPLDTSTTEERILTFLMELEKIGCRHFVTMKDILVGHPNLNLAFVAHLFNKYPALWVETPEANKLEKEDITETREEMIYRNWINSIVVHPSVNYLYTDLRDGLILFKVFEAIKPGIVQWKKVKETFHPLKANFEKLGNCNYVIEIGRLVGLSLQGTCGKDIFDGNKKLTLGLVWQMMRLYSLLVLTNLAKDSRPITDTEILNWANRKVAKQGIEQRLSSFHDSSLSDSTFICHLIEAIKPGTTDFSNFTESKLNNARYCLSCARKIGARVYALPEDIVECKQKMMVNLFAALMTIDYKLK